MRQEHWSNVVKLVLPTGEINLRPRKEEFELDEKCWPGYEKKGMKTMFGKRYPNCVKKKTKKLKKLNLLAYEKGKDVIILIKVKSHVQDDIDQQLKKQ